MNSRICRHLIRLSCCGLLVLVSSAVYSDEMFNQADKDGDGFIGIEDFTAHMTETFFLMDRDKDGVLTGKEMDLLNPERVESAAGEYESGIDLEEFLVETLLDFQRADTDSDQKLKPDDV